MGEQIHNASFCLNWSYFVSFGLLCLKSNNMDKTQTKKYFIFSLKKDFEILLIHFFSHLEYINIFLLT